MPLEEIQSRNKVMKHLKYSVWLIVFLALALVVIGCAKPPEVEKSAAKTAMDGAMSAGANKKLKYAAPDYEAAKHLWDTSEIQITEKKYKETKKGFIDD
jgi:hypothetical protein